MSATTTTTATLFDAIFGTTSELFAAVPLQFSGDFLYLAVVFFVLALAAALVGARGVAGISMEIARILIVVFLILAVVSLIL